jgi:hypothetical protein
MPIAEKPYVIAFNFQASVVLKGHQKEQVVGVTADMPVMIRHAAEADAPVAAVLHGQPDAAGNAWSKRYRLWDGGLAHSPLAKFRRPDGKTFDAHIKAASLARGFATGPRASVTAPLRPRPPAVERVIGLAEYAACRRLVSDNRREVEADIRQRAAMAVFVGGVLHVPTPGPAWDVDVSAYGPVPVRIRARAHIPSGPEIDGHDYARIFRGDRYAEALGAAEAEFARLADEDVRNADAPVVTEGSIDVILPEAFTHDEVWPYLHVACAHVTSQAGPQIWQWRRDEINAFMDLRDAVTAWPSGRTPDVAAAARCVYERTAGAPSVSHREDLGLMLARLACAERVPAAMPDTPAAPGP